MSSANALRWDGGPGHYEVWYVTLTDPASGIGVWLRHTLLAPVDGPAECALWLVAMAPDGDRFARRATFPACITCRTGRMCRPGWASRTTC